MALTPSPRTGKPGYVQFATIIALAAVLLPLVFGQTITVSPLVLLGVAVMPNFLVYLMPTKNADDDRMFSRLFFMRVAASCSCALLLYAIYRFAYALAS